MPNELSQTHQILLISGHRFEGFADEEPAVDFDPVELFRERRSKDGGLHGTATNLKGGPMTIKLEPSSASVKWCLARHAEIQRGERLEFEGSYGDPGLDYNTTLRGGKMVSCPYGITPDKTFEVMFTWERATPEFDAADFDPTPATI